MRQHVGGMLTLEQEFMMLQTNQSAKLNFVVTVKR